MKRVFLILSPVAVLVLGILIFFLTGMFSLRSNKCLPSYQDEQFSYNEDLINILLLGIDCEEELSKGTDFSNWDAGQADTIFLVSVDLQENKVSVIGIPRNSMVALEVYDENGECSEIINNQICLQYGYAGGGGHGLTKMRDVVSKLFYNIPIHGCLAADFASLEVLMKDLGGVDITVPDEMLATMWPMATKGSTLHIDETSIIHYLRYRDITEVGSPTIRLERQKEFLKTLVNLGMKTVKDNPKTILKLYKDLQPYINTDLSVNELAYLALNIRKMEIDFNNFYQLPGRDMIVEFINKDGENDFFDDYYLDGGELKRIMTTVFGRHDI